MFRRLPHPLNERILDDGQNQRFWEMTDVLPAGYVSAYQSDATFGTVYALQGTYDATNGTQSVRFVGWNETVSGSNPRRVLSFHDKGLFNPLIVRRLVAWAA